MKFDDDFDRSIDRMMTTTTILAVVWATFVMGAIGAVIFIAGRYLGVF